MPACVVSWCRSHSSHECSGITFHLFPKKSKRYKRWIAAVRLERRDDDWVPKKNSRVCSIHFHETEFKKSPKGYTIIQKTAVPVCTMTRLEKQSELPTTTFSTQSENGHINTEERITLASRSPSYDKTNIEDHEAHQIQKRKLEYTSISEFNEDVEEESNSKKRKDNRQSISPINILSPDSDIEFALDSPKIHKLKQKLKKTSLLAAKRLQQIRNLKRQNKRLLTKNIFLKDALMQFKERF